MAGSCPVEYHKDIAGERYYASRNFNDLFQTYKATGANRTQLDWNLTLRQQRKNFMKSGKTDGQAASAPNLHTADLQQRRAEPLVPEHQDGKYHEHSPNLERYQNYATTRHMTQNLIRVSSGSAPMLDWQMNLRDGHHQKPDDKWKRHFTRPQVSFDMMKENHATDEYKNTHVTPQDRRPDRTMGAIPVATIRDDPINFKRWSGCEGTQVGQWEHLLEDRRYGHKSRRQMAFDTSLRYQPHDPNGAKLDDARSNGCIVEMLGKKKWYGHVSHEPLATRPPEGDYKLHHMTRMRVLPEEDNENREKRTKRQERLDKDISYKHTEKSKQM